MCLFGRLTNVPTNFRVRNWLLKSVQARQVIDYVQKLIESPTDTRIESGRIETRASGAQWLRRLFRSAVALP